MLSNALDFTSTGWHTLLFTCYIWTDKFELMTFIVTLNMKICYSNTMQRDYFYSLNKINFINLNENTVGMCYNHRMHQWLLQNFINKCLFPWRHFETNSFLLLISWVFGLKLQISSFSDKQRLQMLLFLLYPVEFRINFHLIS